MFSDNMQTTGPQGDIDVSSTTLLSTLAAKHVIRGLSWTLATQRATWLLMVFSTAV